MCAFKSAYPVASSAVATSRVDETPVNSKAHWQTKLKLSWRKQKLGELEVSLIVCPIPWTLREQYFHPFHPKLEISRWKGCIHVNILAMVLSFCKKCSEEPERRAGGLSMVFLIAAWEPTSRISIMKQSYSYLYCNKFPFYQMNILQEEILTKMETSWTGGLSSLQIILKTNPSAWCTSTATSRGT